MTLLLSELVELEQGEGLFDVEGDLMLTHCSPFLPTVGPAALCWPAGVGHLYFLHCSSYWSRLATVEWEVGMS